MDLDKIRADLSALLDDETLFDESNLHARNEAIVFIKYVGDVLKVPGFRGALDPLYTQALTLRDQLIAANEALFRQLRDQLRDGGFAPESLRACFDKFTSYAPGEGGRPNYEYDGLDILLEEVIFPTPPPIESCQRAPDMIRYEATPARVVLEMIDSLRFTPEDIFYDLGSGMGLVVMLVNLLTGVRCVGIEYDPAYCAYARSRAQALNLKNVSFIQSDARDADLNAGTIFYLFTPFVNEIFDSVLERLRYTAIRHPIYICSYGTITYDLKKLPWLQIRDPAMEHDFELAIFTSKQKG